MDPLKTQLIQNVFLGIVFLGYFYLGNEEIFKRRFKLLFISYSCLIIFNVTYSFTILPQFTYEEAMELVESETGKQVVEPPKGNVKAQLGQYFIYTNDEV